MEAPIPSPQNKPDAKYTLQEARILLIQNSDKEIIEREEALSDIRRENFSMLHEDEPAATWIKYVPIGNTILLVILIVIILAVIVPKLG